MLFVHASAMTPESWIYVTDAADAEQSLDAGDANYIFCGHVHHPKLYYSGPDGRLMPFAPIPGVSIPAERHRQWLAIVGSCGQPRDGNNAACYAFFDTERERLTYCRVPYAHGTAAQKILAAGLPPRLALRLEHGT
jgi:diadenosine tetraphosphatase ApaH/serine/threonine PP2A family protein phosphatase